MGNIDYKIATEILEPIQFFGSAESPSDIYAEVDFSGHQQILHTNDERFKAIISENYRCKMHLQYSVSLNEVIKPYIDRALLNEDNRRKVCYRMEGSKNYLEYFLGDKESRRVIINKNGWSIKNKGRYCFVKPTSLKQQCLPDQAGDLLLLDKYINLSIDDLTLLKIHIIQMFMDCSTHFATVLSSKKGTGKTTLSRVIRELVDPSVSSVVSTPSNIGDFQNLLSNSKVCVLDNSAVFSQEISDLICGAITGTTLTARKLYTNLGQVTVSLKSNVIVNGIDIISPKSDLVERSLCYTLLPIDYQNRKTDTEFWEEFSMDKPKILGAIFDVLSKAIASRDSVKLNGRHRMADAYEDMAAIAVAMGVGVERFEEIFDNNITNLQKQFAEGNIVIEAIKTCMDAVGTNIIEGAGGEVFKRLRMSCYGEYGNFPKGPSSLSRYLNSETEALAVAGLSFVRKKEHDNTKFIITRNSKGEGKKDGGTSNTKRNSSVLKTKL